MGRKPKNEYHIERCITQHENEAKAIVSGKWVALGGTAGSSSYVDGWLDCLDALYGGPDGWYRAVDRTGDVYRVMRTRSAPHV